MPSAPLLVLTVAVVAAVTALPTATVPNPVTTSTPTPSAVESAARQTSVTEAVADSTTSTEVIEGDETTPYNAASQRESKEEFLNGWDKERRILELKGYIYNTTRPNKGTPLTVPHNIMTSKTLSNIVRSIMMPAVTSMGELPKKFTSSHPICAPPNNKKVEAAKNSDDMYMMFNLTYLMPFADSKLAIVSANLRLFKISQTDSSAPVEPCNPQNQQVRSTPAPTSSTTQAAEESNPASTPTTSTSSTTSSTPAVGSYPEPREVFIRVTISYLVRQGKKTNKLTRNILDSKMVSTSGEEWVDFNVLNAVKDWRNATNNMGLFVEVEDQERKKLPAAKFFREMNCSAAVSKPIPSVLFDAGLVPESRAAPDLISALMLPMISLCTTELPNIEMHAPSSFYPLTSIDSNSEDLRNIIMSYSRLHHGLEHSSTTEKQAAVEEEQVVSMQVQNTEEHHPEHHPRRHRNRHHNHRHANRDGDASSKRDSRHKGQRNQHNTFHTVSSDREQRVDVVVVPVVLQTSRVAEMDDQIQEVNQQPIPIEELFQR